MSMLEPGYRWLTTTSTTTVYPTNGQGGTTGTPGSSELVNSKDVTIYAIRIIDTPTTAVNTTVTLTDGAGNDLQTFKFQTTSSAIRIGDINFGPRGIIVQGAGFGVRVANANLKIAVSYREAGRQVQALVS